MVNIIEKHITSDSRPRTKNKGVDFFVAHDTGNSGSTAKGNINYFQNQAPTASAHFFVDDTGIYEMVPQDEKAWHVIYNVTTDNRMFGDDANDVALGVELCFGGRINFKKAYDNYVDLFAYLCKKYNKNPHEHIVGHSKLDPARKTDPENALNRYGISFKQFINDVEARIGNGVAGISTNSAPKYEGKFFKEYHSDWWMKEKPETLEAQKLLNELGYNAGPEDGILGQKTLDAVREFHDDENISYNGASHYGVPGPKTRKALKQAIKEKESGGKLPDGVLERGDRGADVRKVQQALASVHFYPNKDAKNHGIDGIYGPNTEDAVERFQSVHVPDEVDGVYGPNTKAALLKAMD